MINRVGSAKRTLLLAREGVALARSQPVASAVTGVVVAAVTAVILATVGQTAAAEGTILDRFDEAGARTIIVSDPTGQASLYPDSVNAVKFLDGVTWVIGLGPVIDVRNAALGQAGAPVPLRRLYGGLPNPLLLLMGRQPRPGEALAGTEAMRFLGMTVAAGGVSGGNVSAPVVGGFSSSDPLAFLNGSIVLPASADVGVEAQRLRQIVVLVSGPERVDSLTEAIDAVLHVEDRTQLRVAAPAALVKLRSLVSEELATSSRAQLLIVLAVGLLLTSVTQFGAIAQRRMDFGRRRALGASRSVVVLLVIIQTVVASAVGALVGSAAGTVAVLRLVDAPPPADFTFGVAVLALLAASAAAIPPALVAAFRDPVRILRVP